jgi:Putative peptidoglycan binding domain
VTGTATPTPASDYGAGERGASKRLRRVGAGAALVVVVAVAAFAIDNHLRGGGGRAAGYPDNGVRTSLVTVRRQTLTAQAPFTASLGYAGSYTVTNQAGGDATGSTSTTGATGAAAAASGTFTSLPRIGETVTQGRVLYRVDGAPVVLLYGATPAYRSLSEGMTGADVAELNADLVRLGYATRTELDPHSDAFGWETALAVEKLQLHLGLAGTGTLELGQAVFLPAAARVTSLLVTLGAPAVAGDAVLATTSTWREVSIALDPADEAEVKVGDHVTITLPDGRTTPGVVSSVGKVAGVASSSASSSSGSAPGGGGSGSASGSAPTIAVLVRPTRPRATGSWDQAAVTVTVTTAVVRHVLAVPVDALLALAGGGYAVEVASADGVHRLVPVTLGLFDDATSRVQVSGAGLQPGQQVVVPGQ